MKFVSKYFILLIIVITIIIKLSYCLNSGAINNHKKINSNPHNIVKRCPGYSENLSKQDEIEVSNYVIFFFILSYFYTNYL